MKSNTSLLLKLAEELLDECRKCQAADHLSLNHDTFIKKARKALGITTKARRAINSLIPTTKLTFARLEAEAEKRGLWIEKIQPPTRFDGQTYRYRIDGQNGVVTDVETLDEAWSEIFHWKRS